ncbi:hypothetical protein F5Y13DRAFT_70979 [Hypoxylon sp. FL1857]|nr:hypothetical protein F5Y13DRAFT_70979 [Hypoxylon sp. FL1857]
MSSLFCCSSITPYRPQALLHERRFVSFMNWPAYPRESSPATKDDEGNAKDEGSTSKKTNLIDLKPDYVVQLVRQVNYGPLESKRFFAAVNGQSEAFIEVTEDDLIDANFQKLNSYKNFRCDAHNKFFEINLYQKDPINKHHWRYNAARPASSIDL